MNNAVVTGIKALFQSETVPWMSYLFLEHQILSFETCKKSNTHFSHYQIMGNHKKDFKHIISLCNFSSLCTLYTVTRSVPFNE